MTTDDGLVEVSGVVYGVRLEGRLPAPFRQYLLAVGGHRSSAPDRLDVGYRPIEELPEVDEVWAAEVEWPPDGGRFALFRLPGGFGVTVSAGGRGLFLCSSEAIRVEWATAPEGAAHAFFSYALPLWLETHGVPVLHASVVSVDGRAVAFLGPSGMGKSVLCGELLRLGCRFVADDGLAPRRDPADGWRCFPGPPLLRLWPSGLAGRLGIPSETLPRVHEGLEKRRLQLSEGGAEPEAEGAGVPLAAIYLLARSDGPGEVRSSELTPRDALVHLLEHGVATGPAAVLGLSGRRFEVLADLADAVPVRRLEYPSGTDSAEAVLKAIRQDLCQRGV